MNHINPYPFEVDRKLFSMGIAELARKLVRKGSKVVLCLEEMIAQKVRSKTINIRNPENFRILSQIFH